ncbi:MAG: hypothetical protein JSV00_02445 [bacterium]|nr:MAG: hypothetical protein JSV00_02445 [bacterium]
MPRDTYICPLCRKTRKREKYHCRDHCMDMCSDHVRETAVGRFLCLHCEKVVHRFLHNGREWVQA